jgi:hypothetical protein
MDMRIVFSTLLTIVTLAGVLVVPPFPAAAASNSSVYWGAYLVGSPADTTQMDALESRVGKKASLEMMGQPWMMNGQYQAFPAAYLQKIRDRGTIPVLDWGSSDLCCGTAQPNFSLANIANGAHDPFLIQWAQASKAWGHPFFIRFDAEMNGWWRPWSEQLNGNQPGDFARAWRHVVDVFRAQGATNVTWVWCPNIVGPRSTPMSSMYPGDNYVDWTGVDGYNFGTDRNNAWQTFNQIFGFSAYDGGFNTYQLLQQAAPSKPIMVVETASSENGGSKAAWITDMLTVQLPNNFPQIKAFMWFDWNENDSALSWPIESSGAATQAFASGIASSYYATNEFGALSTSPIPALNPAPAQAQAAPAAAPPPGAGGGGSVTLNPVQDTYITRAAPDSTAGGSKYEMSADQAGSDTTYMRFDMSGLAGKTITSATLHIHTSWEAWAGSSGGFNVIWVTDTGWWEPYMSFNHTVPLYPLRLGGFTPTYPSQWYATSLTTSVVQFTAGGGFGLAIQGTVSDMALFYAREAGADLAPQLELTYQ